MNKVIAIGNLCKDSKVEYTLNGDAYYNNTLVDNERYADKDGQVKETTVFINFTIWGKAAEVFAQYTQKGSQVFIEGSWKTDTYEKSGEKRYSTKVNVRNFRFLDTKGGAEKANSDSNFAESDLGF